MSWICFHIENERLLKAAVSEEIRVECDKLFRQRGCEERGRWIPEKEVILSYIVEGVYYAAVRTTDRFGKSFVYAAVLPLCIQKGMYYNLLCNEQYEGELPQECQCPMEILLLLSSTDSVLAQKWRNNCWNYHKKEHYQEYKTNVRKQSSGYRKKENYKRNFRRKITTQSWYKAANV